MTRPVVVTVCGDPGGAAALAPVLMQLRREGIVRLESYAYRHGLALIEERGLEPRAIPPGADEAWVAGEIAARDAALVLVATSHNEHNYEKLFIAAAAARGIPSLAVLDFWANYGARFADAAGRLRFVPDRVAAMDEVARQGLIAAGLAPSAIIVTGHPAFDALAEQRAAFTGAERARLRAMSGAADDGLLILFASQPLRELYGPPQSPGHSGYDEHSVLAGLVPAIENTARKLDRSITLVIRPHPREPLEPYLGYTSRTVRIVVSREGEARAMAMAADLVLGMTSMLLVEAHFLGCRVVSVQPERSGSDILPRSVSDEIVMIDRTAEIDAAIHVALAGEPAAAPRAGPVRLPAVPRVVSCVYSLVGKSDGASAHSPAPSCRDGR